MQMQWLPPYVQLLYSPAKYAYSQVTCEIRLLENILTTDSIFIGKTIDPVVMFAAPSATSGSSQHILSLWIFCFLQKREDNFLDNV